VLWAIASRANLDNVQVIKRLQTKASRPKVIVPGQQPVLVNDRVIIDACWPYERRDRFPVTSRFSVEYQEKIIKKWQSLF
jgi:hypothetical protein